MADTATMTIEALWARYDEIRLANRFTGRSWSAADKAEKAAIVEELRIRAKAQVSA